MAVDHIARQIMKQLMAAQKHVRPLSKSKVCGMLNIIIIQDLGLSSGQSRTKHK